MRILLLAATLSLVIGVVKYGWRAGWIEGAAIYLAVCAITTVTAGNNWIKEKQFQQLFQKASEDMVAVYRGNEGITVTIPF